MIYDPTTGLPRPSGGGGNFLKLDQTTPQSMSGVWAFKWVAPDTLQLWVNGELRQSWTTTIATPASGSYMGFGAFNYA